MQQLRPSQRRKDDVSAQLGKEPAPITGKMVTRADFVISKDKRLLQIVKEEAIN